MSLHKVIPFAFFILFSSCDYFGGKGVPESGMDEFNARPVIQNMMIKHSSDSQIVNIQYDLHDAEELRIGIEVFYSLDGGLPVQFLSDKISGDVGEDVSVGTGKKIRIPLVMNNSKTLRITLLAKDNKELAVRRVIEKVDTVNLKGYVKEVYGIRSFLTDTAHLAYTRSVIRDSLSNYGYEVRSQNFDFKGYPGENIIARKPGYGSDPKKLIICAHFDSTTDSPGADDNASGVAGILEIARVLADIPTENTIEIVGLDMEEVGLVGSKNYVQELLENGESILGAINLDMIGYMSNEKNSQRVPAEIALALPRIKQQMEENDFVGDFVVCVANENSKELRDEFLESREKFVADRKIISILVPGNGELLPDLRYSDHTSFWDQGYPAIFIGDGADSRNPNYHTEKDQIQLLQYGFMKDIVQTTLALALIKGDAMHATVASSEINL